MKLLTIDRGNTNTTLGIHQNGELESVTNFDSKLIIPHTPIMISNVGRNQLEIPNQFPLKNFRSETHFVDMPVNYAMSLGDDRLATAYYAYKKELKKIMIIDSGTFLTVDFVDQNGFLGGYIFPGIKKILNTYSDGAQLPHELDESKRIELETIPQNTESAILAATNKMISSSLNNIIENEKPNKIIVSGGDAKKIYKMLNSSIQVDLIHHLVHLGLSQIHQNLISLKLI